MDREYWIPEWLTPSFSLQAVEMNLVFYGLEPCEEWSAHIERWTKACANLADAFGRAFPTAKQFCDAAGSAFGVRR